MPADTEPPRPNGLPIAITHWPMRVFSESPNFTAFSGLSGFTRNTAKSTFVSLPTISAFNLRPSAKITVTSLASPITCALVTTIPDASITNPEPSELDLRCGRPCGPGASPPPGPFLKKSSKKSWNGEPGGNCGMGTVRWSFVVVVAEMLTTESITCAATSAMISGPRDCAKASCGAPVSASAAVAARSAGRRARVKRDMDGSLRKRGADRAAQNINRISEEEYGRTRTGGTLVPPVWFTVSAGRVAAPWNCRRTGRIPIAGQG